MIAFTARSSCPLTSVICCPLQYSTFVRWLPRSFTMQDDP